MFMSEWIQRTNVPDTSTNKTTHNYYYAKDNNSKNYHTKNYDTENYYTKTNKTNKTATANTASSVGTMVRLDRM